MTLALLPARPRTQRMPILRIDAEALKANWRMLAGLAAGARTGAAVKANGYGLGAVDVAAALLDAGCRDLFVAWASEGAAVRQALGHEGADARIFVLQGLDADAIRLCLDHRLTPVLSTPEDVASWQELGRAMPAALQVETGMNRLGLGAGDLEAAADLVRRGALRPSLVMSHLASADEPDSPQNAEQLRRFRELSALFPGVPRSLANSAGVFLGTDYRFDLTRPGIALYGGSAGPLSEGKIRPVATLTAHVLQLRTVETGGAAGYGAAARLSRDTRIATVGLGYADGYLRSTSGAGVPVRDSRPAPDVFVAGQRAPVLGRVSMDLTLVDVTHLPDNAVAPGDPVEFFGPNIPIDEVAHRAGTIAYELLTSLGPRIYRDWHGPLI